MRAFSGLHRIFKLSHILTDPSHVEMDAFTSSSASQKSPTFSKLFAFLPSRRISKMKSIPFLHCCFKMNGISKRVATPKWNASPQSIAFPKWTQFPEYNRIFKWVAFLKWPPFPHYRASKWTPFPQSIASLNEPHLNMNGIFKMKRNLALFIQFFKWAASSKQTTSLKWNVILAI